MPTEKERISGLVLRGKTWWIDKKVSGKRICESCRTSDYQEAVKYFCFRVEQLRQAEIFGVRPKRIWREAAIKYLNEAEKESIRCDALQLKMLDGFIGDLPLDSIHMGTLQGFLEWRKSQGLKKRTINYALQVVRHILNLCAGEWMDEHGMTWLHSAPKIKLFRETDKRPPYPLSWDEQMALFSMLPPYLVKMALFAVNSGCREQEICGLKWDWEIDVPELNTSVFIIPGESVKNNEDRLVVLNRVAKQVIEDVRGENPEYVFTYQGKKLRNMNNRAWKQGRASVGLSQVRVHDLKHTFGRRLRAAGITYEDRQDLLGRKSGWRTTHYSMPELVNLITAANAVCEEKSRKSHAMIILKKKFHLELVKQVAVNAR
jgi:integrase